MEEEKKLEGQGVQSVQTGRDEQGVQGGQGVQSGHEGSRRDELHALLKSEIEGYSDDDDEGNYGRLIEYVERGKADRDLLSKALADNPALAQVFADVVSGKRGAGAALARYFGKEALSVDEGSPEFAEIQKAEEERKSELERYRQSQRQYDENVERTLPGFKKLVEAAGLDADDYLEKIWDRIIYPVTQGLFTKEVFDFLQKGLEYDADVSDAKAAGVVEGRNENINKMRSRADDGLPKGLPSGGGRASGEKREISIFDLARMAR